MGGKSKSTPFLKVPLYGETVEDAIRDLLDVDVSVDEDCLHLGWVYLKIWNFLCTLQMFAGIYRDFAGKSEYRDFKFTRIACIPAIPVIFEVNQKKYGLFIYTIY